MNKNISEMRGIIGFKMFQMILKVVIPLIFLITGLILLFLALPGWSLILGIPSTVFGIVFLLYAYDDLSQMNNHNMVKQDPDDPDIQ